MLDSEHDASARISSSALSDFVQQLHAVGCTAIEHQSCPECVPGGSEQLQGWEVGIQEFIKTKWGLKIVLDPWHFPAWIENRFILAECCSQTGYRASHLWAHFWKRWNGVGMNKSSVFSSGILRIFLEAPCS